MSTESKVKPRKVKKTNEKEKRLTQLERKIARLEQENKILKQDSVEYKKRLETILHRGVGTLKSDNKITPLTEGPKNVLSPEKILFGGSGGKRKAASKRKRKNYGN